MHYGQQSKLMESHLIFNQGRIFKMINYLAMTTLMIPKVLFLYRGSILVLIPYLEQGITFGVACPENRGGRMG